MSNQEPPETNIHINFGTSLLERIGHGHCGSVWSPSNPSPSPSIVIKREDASPGRNIANEVAIQTQAHDSFKASSQAAVPKCLGLMDKHDPRWKQVLPLLPSGFQACRAMLAEKIEPISQHAQLLFVNTYCSPENRHKMTQSLLVKKDHCLARIYLGRRRQMVTGQRHGPRFFSLRNFPIHADQAEELALPRADYARAMAEALAILHWKVRTNGADVEFVLAAPRHDSNTRPDEDNETTPLGEHALWMLDFDCSRPIEADESGQESIARAFWRNDPYYPQPGSTCLQDRELWDVFAAEYRRVGREVVCASARLGEDVGVLCELVDGAVARIVDTRGKWKTGGHFKLCTVLKY